MPSDEVASWHNNNYQIFNIYVWPIFRTDLDSCQGVLLPDSPQSFTGQKWLLIVPCHLPVFCPSMIWSLKLPPTKVELKVESIFICRFESIFSIEIYFVQLWDKLLGIFLKEMQNAKIKIGVCLNLAWSILFLRSLPVYFCSVYSPGRQNIFIRK